MNWFVKVHDGFWHDRKVISLSDRAAIAYSYVTTCYDSHGVAGLLELIPAVLSHYRGWTPEQSEVALGELNDLGLIQWDRDAAIIYVPKAIQYNPPKNSNKIRSWLNKTRRMTESHVLAEWLKELETHVRSRDLDDSLPGEIASMVNTGSTPGQQEVKPRKESQSQSQSQSREQELKEPDSNTVGRTNSARARKPESGSGASQSKEKRKSSLDALNNLTVEELTDPQALANRFRRCCKVGVVQESESGWRNFVSMAAHCLRLGKEPCALFRSNVERAQWQVLTDKDDDIATITLRKARERAIEQDRSMQEVAHDMPF